MTLITVQDGKIVFRDGAVGTEQACCCLTEPLPNCCEEENVLLQVTLEINGLADDTWTGCGCLNGTYVADVVDVLTDTDPPLIGIGFGNSVQPQPGCLAVDQGGNEYTGHVYIVWACDGSFAEGDWGFRDGGGLFTVPWIPNDYPLTDMMRVSFDQNGVIYGDTATAGVPCVGGSASGFVNFRANGCDRTNLTATITVQ